MNQFLANWQRLVALGTTPDVKLKMFRRAAHDLGQRADDTADVVDRLKEMALGHSFFGLGEEQVEQIIGDEIERGRQEQPRTNGGEHDEQPLRYVDLSLPLTSREWCVHERIPNRNVSMLGGEGAIGKSLLLMQLSGAVVLAKEWIGTLPEQGPVLYMSCEEEDDEVRRRMEDVARHLGSTRQELIDHGLRVLSYAGEDSVLAQPDRAGVMRPTPLFEHLRREAVQLRPKLIVIDTVADVFAGRENDRAQTRQFITMLRGLAIASDSAVVIAAHPSLTGITNDTGLSGSTGWHNSVRARMYFKSAPGDDIALRVLEVKKSNYGPVTESFLLRWRDGVYVREPGKGRLERLAADAEVDYLFLKLVRRFADQGRNVSDNKSSTYAPAVFADEPETKTSKVTKKMLADAMARLFAARKLRAVPFGSPSKQRSRIVEVGNEQPESATILPFNREDAFQPPSNRKNSLPTASQPPSNPPSNGFQPPSNGVCSNPPVPPPSVGRGQEGLGDEPRPSQPREAAARTFDVLGLEPDASCVECGRTDGTVYLIRDRFGGVAGEPLHEHCARVRFAHRPTDDDDPM